MSADGTLLAVRGLGISLGRGAAAVPLVDGVSFELQPGERLALVGESGSGKTMTALSVLGLVDPPCHVEADAITFEGQDLSRLSPAALRRIRGRRIGFVPQDPFSSLDPLFTVGDQVAAAIRFHERVGRREARDRAVALLAAVGVPDPARRAREHPHALSGGLRQRVVIAAALACSPSLVIADEPTTALDVTIQAQVIELLATLSEERGTAVLLISHDLGVVAGFAETVAVMYAGAIMEQGPRRALYSRPQHPYTRALLESQPRRGAGRGRLAAIAGVPPRPGERELGCPFRPRCVLGRDRVACAERRPVLVEVGPGRRSACHFARELAS
jgi:oligopeptide/dipeptide ABC transporter ATP-binding protein